MLMLEADMVFQEGIVCMDERTVKTIPMSDVTYPYVIHLSDDVDANSC